MRSRLLALAVLISAAAVIAVPGPDPVRGCAPAPGRGGSVQIASETAVIVWDAKAKVQHFVRAASFTSTSAEFGFLVPTPTKPELAEANESAFATLAELTAPRVVVERRANAIGCAVRETSFAGAAPNASVSVLERSRVGNLDYAILRADDPKELRAWLAKNEFDARPELERWLAAYTANKWVVTAFKIAADAPAAGADGKPFPAGGAAVRMSFPADRPFFPYREPDDQRADPPGRAWYPRLLRVYLLADARYDGTLGGPARWPGQTVWAGPVPGERFAPLMAAAKLPDDLAGRAWHLTEFEDRSSPRPGTDEVYFAPAADQSAVERSPTVRYEYYEPVGLIVGVLAACAATPVVLLIAGLLAWRLLRRTIA